MLLVIIIKSVDVFFLLRRASEYSTSCNLLHGFKTAALEKRNKPCRTRFASVKIIQ